MILRASALRIPPLLFCTGLMCLAQSGGGQTQNTPEITTHESTHESTPTFSTGVNLVMVPVVVRDAQGHAVGTLHQEDFRLFDKGKLQAIAKFSIEKTDTSLETGADGSPRPSLTTTTPVGTLAAQPIAQHFLAWLFDDVHLPFADLVQARAAALRLLKGPLEPGTRLAVLTTSGHVALDFTDDRDKLTQALNQIKPFPVVGGSDIDCPAISYYQADRIQNLNDEEARLAAEVAYVVNCYGPPGFRKSDVDEAMRVAHQVVKALVPRAILLGNQATEANLGILKELIRRMAVMPGTRSVVLVSPGFFLRSDRQDIATDLMDRALRAGVVINSFSTQGVRAIVPGGTAEAPPGLPIDAEQEFERKRAYADEGIMQDLAGATGGTFFHNDNDYFGGLKRLAEQPEYIYLLGFSPQNSKLDGSFHTLKVTLLHGAGLQLQARRGYFVDRPETGAEAQREQQVREAFFSRDEIHGLPMELLTELTSDPKANLSILARVDLKGLSYKRTDGRNDDTLTLMAGVFDRDGKYITGSLRTVDLKLKDQTLEQYPKERMTIRTNLDVASGSYTVRLVVRDSEGQIMSAQNSAVVIP